MQHRFIAMVLATIVSVATVCHAQQWPRFRGNNGDGQSEATGIPIEWKTGEYAWKKPLPGLGRSSPVVWDDRVYVTSANPDTGEQIILAFDAHTGEQLWEKRFASATHHQHVENSYATSTPAVDATRLYMSWLDGDKITLGAKPKLLVRLEPAEIVVAPGTTVSAMLKVERNGHDDLITFSVENLPHGVIVDNIGLNGVLMPKGESERQIFITADSWVPETSRLAFAVENQAGSQCSTPVMVHVRKASPLANAAGK